MEILSFYTCLQQMTIIWCTVPEIWSATDRIFFYFGPSFALLPPNNPGNKNFDKMKKALGDIIILYMFTKNHASMMYTSWDMDATDLIFCHFGPFFALLPHYWRQKLKFKKK